MTATDRGGLAVPTFSTPAPIELRVRLGGGEVAIVAEARADTEVDVQPCNPASRADVEMAEATTVDHRDGVVTVEAPGRNGWRFGRSGSIAVRVALPEGSAVHVDAASADVTSEGRLGSVEATTASGDVEIEHAEVLSIKTASGDVVARHADGDVSLGTASGEIWVVEVGGDAQLSSASGDVHVGHAGGDVGIKTASGDALVDDVEGSVTAKTASGDAEVRRVRRGTVAFDTASGDLSVGIVEGTAAWLDVQSLTGKVHTSLNDADGPVEGGDTVRIRARTISGDVSITRAS